MIRCDHSDKIQDCNITPFLFQRFQIWRSSLAINCSKNFHNTVGVSCAQAGKGVGGKLGMGF